MNNHSQLFPDKKERTDFWIAISVIVIFLAAIIFYLFRGTDKIEGTSIASSVNQTTENKKEFSYAKKEETIDVENQNTDIEEGQIDESVAPAEPERVEGKKDNSIPVSKEELLPIENKIIESELSTTSTLKEELPEYIDEETSEAEEEVPYKEEEPVEETIIKIPEVIEESKAEISSNTEKVEEVNPKNRNIKLESTTKDTQYGCIIIIGSFKESANAKTLSRKLEKQDYPVYEGIYKGYYIVGVNSDCATKKITPLLRKMRRDYEESAWIYKR